MLGQLSSSQDKRATVIGGGIGGLIAAYRLMRADYTVTLIEASPRLGGLIATSEHALGLAEAAAHSLLASPEVIELCAELGVELTAARPEAKARYLVRGGRLRRMPLKFFELIEMLFRILFVRAPQPHAGESAESLETWAKRHLGAAPLRWLVAPGVQGIYAAAPAELSVRAAFKKLLVAPGRTLAGQIWHNLKSARAERRRTGTPRARRPLMTPLGGMQALIRALERELRASPEVWIRTETPVDVLPTAQGTGDIVLALPAPALAKLFAEVDSELAAACGRIRYAPLVSATVFLRRDAFVHAPSGVGVLIPREEQAPCLGILYNSSTFAGRVKDEQNWISLSVLMGGTSDGSRSGEGTLIKSDAEIMQAIERSLALYYQAAKPSDGFGVNADHVVIRRWPAAVPVYGPELLAMHEAFYRSWGSAPGHLLAGNLAGEVSIRGMIEASRVKIKTTVHSLDASSLAMHI